METKRPNFRAGLINARLLLVVVLLGAPFVYFAYVAFDQATTGGVVHRDGLDEVDLKSLGNFAFPESYGTREDVPLRWRSLDGKRVALEGFMYDAASARESRNFQFVYNRTKCCFNGPPLVQERVFAGVPNGSVPYFDEECRLVGKLRVNVVNPTGDKVDSVFEVNVERIEPLRHGSWMFGLAAGVVVVGAVGTRVLAVKRGGSSHNMLLEGRG